MTVDNISDKKKTISLRGHNWPQEMKQYIERTDWYFTCKKDLPGNILEEKSQ